MSYLRLLVTVLCIGVRSAQCEPVTQLEHLVEAGNITGEEARAVQLAVTEFDNQKLQISIAEYVVRIYQSRREFVVLFGSPSERPGEYGSRDPIGFEVTVSRESGKVTNSHFER